MTDSFYPVISGKLDIHRHCGDFLIRVCITAEKVSLKFGGPTDLWVLRCDLHFMKSWRLAKVVAVIDDGWSWRKRGEPAERVG